MIVRCIANTGSVLSAANLDPRRGYDSLTEFPLTLECEYHVFALTVFLGTAWYYVLDDDGHEWPTWSPAALFDVVDGAIPSGWIVGNFRFLSDDQYPVISFPEWAADRSFYESLVNGESEAVRIFATRRAEIESSHPLRG